MYDLAYYNPRMSGNVYRGTRKCGKASCRCSISAKHKHPFWRLEYRVKHNGRWVRKREYVPKSKVKALRQRIKRAKQRDLNRRRQIKLFLQQANDYLKGKTGTTEILTLNQEKVEPITLKQRAKLLNIYVQLIIRLEGLR